MSVSQISATPSAESDIIVISSNVGSSVVDGVLEMCETHDDEAMKIINGQRVDLAFRASRESTRERRKSC